MRQAVKRHFGRLADFQFQKLGSTTQASRLLGCGVIRLAAHVHHITELDAESRASAVRLCSLGGVNRWRASA
jgi:hypothetical protein